MWPARLPAGKCVATRSAGRVAATWRAGSSQASRRPRPPPRAAAHPLSARRASAVLICVLQAPRPPASHSARALAPVNMLPGTMDAAYNSLTYSPSNMYARSGRSAHYSLRLHPSTRHSPPTAPVHHPGSQRQIVWLLQDVRVDSSVSRAASPPPDSCLAAPGERCAIAPGPRITRDPDTSTSAAHRGRQVPSPGSSARRPAPRRGRCRGRAHLPAPQTPALWSAEPP